MRRLVTKETRFREPLKQELLFAMGLLHEAIVAVQEGDPGYKVKSEHIDRAAQAVAWAQLLAERCSEEEALW